MNNLDRLAQDKMLEQITDEAFECLISVSEALGYLDEINIRGTFTALGFEGYDYSFQRIIEIEA